MHKAQNKARAVIIGMIGFHLACFGAIYTGVSRTAGIVAGVLYFLRAFGVTAGYHRLLAHSSYRASRPVRFMLALMGSCATQGGPLWWASHHRRHHRYSEREGDVHSPVQRGFWYAHMGWMWDAVCFGGNYANVKDLHRYPEIKILQKGYVFLIVGQALSLFGLGALLNWLFPDLGTSGLQMLVWGFFISTVALWHATFAVNSVCHLWGTRPNAAGDGSRNNFLVALLTLGEGWHNNHHAFPKSAFHGLRWWQVDASSYVIRTLEALRLVKNVYRVPDRLMEARLHPAPPADPQAATPSRAATASRKLKGSAPWRARRATSNASSSAGRRSIRPPRPTKSPRWTSPSGCCTRTCRNRSARRSFTATTGSAT